RPRLTRRPLLGHLGCLPVADISPPSLRIYEQRIFHSQFFAPAVRTHIRWPVIAPSRVDGGAHSEHQFFSSSSFYRPIEGVSKNVPTAIEHGRSEERPNGPRTGHL